MTFETTLVYNEPMLRKAVLRFWWRVIGIRFLLVLAALGLLLAFLIIQGDRSWSVGVLGTMVVMGGAFAAAVYVVHFVNVMGKFRGMGGAPASCVVDASSFIVTSRLGAATLPWSAFEEVWQFEDVWLLMLSKSQFVTLPLDCVPENMRRFMLERIRAAGGRVKRD